MNKLVLFKDNLEDSSQEQYGILCDDETVICLCCLGVLEKEDYQILADYDELPVDISEIIAPFVERSLNHSINSEDSITRNKLNRST